MQIKNVWLNKMENKEKIQEILNKEIKIKYSEILAYDPSKVPMLAGMDNWDKDHPMTEEYRQMMEELGMLARYMAMKMSSGCGEVKESMIKRCACLSVILHQMIESMAIDGWHMYGLTAELHHDVYMNMGGRSRTIELLNIIRERTQKLNQKRQEEIGRGLYE